MGLPWSRLFKYAPLILLLLGEALPPLSAQQRSGGEWLTNLTALFRCLSSSMTSPLAYTKHGLQPFVLRGLVCEPLRLAQTAQGGEWSCDSEHLCTLAGMASPSWSPEGLIQRPAQRRHPHGFYQAGRYWPSLAPLFHQAARVPEKLSDVSRST